MKKSSFLFLIFFFSFNVFAQHYDHWSLQLRGGVNKHRGYNVFPLDGAISAEYTITPLIGVGVEMNYMTVGINRTHQEKNKKGCVYGSNHRSHIFQCVAYASLNVVNLGVREYTKWAAFINLGAGAGCGDWGFKLTNNANVAVFIGPSCEYNIDDHFAVGLDIRYWWNSNDKYHGVCLDANGNAIVTDGRERIHMDGVEGFYEVSLGVRYKFTPWKRKGYHVRDADVSRMRKF